MAVEQIEHLEGPGGVVYSPASAHSKEMAKWETRPLENGSVTQAMIDAARRAGVHQGVFEHREYPKAMYKAEQTPNGIKVTDMSQSAADEIQERNLQSRGYRGTQADAIARVEAENFAVAEAAANRAFYDRRMSAQAQAEAEAVDRRVARHLGEIPAAKLPPKRRGRPAKPATVPAG